MKILVLGANSSADSKHSGGMTWLDVVREGLETAHPGTVQFVATSFAPIGAGAPSFAERKVIEADPDLVIIPAGPYVFSFGFVWKRVEALFGRRAGAWYKRLEDGFDEHTQGSEHLARTANVWARKVVRAVIGTKPLATQSEVSECYSETLCRISRVENVNVALVAYPGLAPHKRGTKSRWRDFYRALEETALSHHYVWVDGRDAFATEPNPRSLLAADGLHPSSEGNRIFGAAVLRAVDRALSNLPEGDASSFDRVPVHP